MMSARYESPTAELLPLVRADFDEMPGMRLTLAQAARLWNTDTATCARALQSLIDAGYLRRTAELYVRADTGRRRV